LLRSPIPYNGAVRFFLQFVGEGEAAISRGELLWRDSLEIMLALSEPNVEVHGTVNRFARALWNEIVPLICCCVSLFGFATPVHVNETWCY
jgi:hypothetical protein